MVCPAPLALADSNARHLLKLLKTSSTARVRAQAAISLGSFREDIEVLRGLGAALQDDDSAVRLAVTVSLSRLNSREALPWLAKARHDGDARVRREVERAITGLQSVGVASTRSTSLAVTPELGPPGPQARYYVGVGMPATRAAGIDLSTLQETRELIRRDLRQIPEVVLAPDAEPRSRAEVFMQRHTLFGYFIDSSIVELENRGAGVRAVVSVVLGTYPGRDIKAMLRGAASVPDGQGKAAEKMAIEGALSSALQRMAQAMRAGDPQRFHVQR